MRDSVLCYVDGCFAYFTTQSLNDQWGDDWNDAPYEHNAGTPYRYHPVADKREGKAPWKIYKIAFDGPFVQPCDGHVNSEHSVQSINESHGWWLKTDRWCATHVRIDAGVTLGEFIKLIKSVGGETYVPSEFASLGE